MIDTGASTSIINTGIVHPQVERFKNTIELTTASGSFTCDSFVEITPLSEFKLPSSNRWAFLEHNFSTNFDVLLGSDILFKIGAVVELKLKKLITDRVELNLFTREEDEMMVNYNHISPSSIEDLRTGHLNPEEMAELKILMSKFGNLLYREGDRLTFTHEIRHIIPTISKAPVFTKLYRYPEIHKLEVEKQVADMLHCDIIRHSSSPYCSPIWVVPKRLDASGKQKWRIVID